MDTVHIKATSRLGGVVCGLYLPWISPLRLHRLPDIIDGDFWGSVQFEMNTCSRL